MAGGKVGRFACIFVPMVLTMATLCFLAIVGLGQTNAKNNYLSNLYFVRFNMTNVTTSDAYANNPINQHTDLLDRTPNGKIIIQNLYSVGLWNYCAGAGGNVTKSVLAIGQKSSQSVNFCTGRSLQWGFDPSIVWGIPQKTQMKIISEDWNNWMTETYLSKSSKWMSTLYILAVTFTAMQILVGIGGLFSRLGSLFTTIFSFFTTGINFAFALFTTLVYIRMRTFNPDLQKSGVSIELGSTILIYMWFAWAASFVGGLFWAFSSCCCSGRPREVKAEKQAMTENPYTYERVTEHPFGTTQTVMSNRPASYDTGFRHGQ